MRTHAMVSLPLCKVIAQEVDDQVASEDNKKIQNFVWKLRLKERSRQKEKEEAKKKSDSVAKQWTRSDKGRRQAWWRVPFRLILLRSYHIIIVIDISLILQDICCYGCRKRRSFYLFMPGNTTANLTKAIVIQKGKEEKWWRERNNTEKLTCSR